MTLAILLGYTTQLFYEKSNEQKYNNNEKKYSRCSISKILLIR